MSNFITLQNWIDKYFVTCYVCLDMSTYNHLRLQCNNWMKLEKLFKCLMLPIKVSGINKEESQVPA